MSDRERNIGMFAVRVAANTISFKKLQAQQKALNEAKESAYNSIEKKEIIEETTETVILEDVDSGEKLDLEDNVIIDTSRTKNIVTTQINGQIGTVKEWINDGDVAINLTIIVNGDDEIYPDKKLKEVMNFLKKNKTLYIYNKHLNDIVGVKRIVITSWKHTPEIWNSSQEIAVDAISDETYKIEEEILKNS